MCRGITVAEKARVNTAILSLPHCLTVDEIPPVERGLVQTHCGTAASLETVSTVTTNYKSVGEDLHHADDNFTRSLTNGSLQRGLQV